MHLSEGSGKPVEVSFEEIKPSWKAIKECEKIEREVRGHLGDLLRVTGLGLLVIVVMGTVRFTNW